MPLPFVLELLGFAGDKPNTADGDSSQSVAIAGAVLDILGINGPAEGGNKAGAALEVGVFEFMRDELPKRDPSVHGTSVGEGRSVSTASTRISPGWTNLFVQTLPCVWSWVPTT